MKKVWFALLLCLNISTHLFAAAASETLAGQVFEKDEYGNYWIHHFSDPAPIPKIIEAIKHEEKRAGVFVTFPHEDSRLCPPLAAAGFNFYRANNTTQTWLFSNGREIPEQSNALGDSRLVIINNANEILLIQNRNTSFWYLPGGGVNSGELAINAAIREAYEEVGLKFENAQLELIATVNQVISIAKKPTNSFGQVYITRVSGRPELKVDADEIEQVVWVPLDSLEGESPKGVEIFKSIIMLKYQFNPHTSRKGKLEIPKPDGTSMRIETFSWDLKE